MARLKLGPCCCVECPTKEEAGLPDALKLLFSNLTSDDLGMPADSILAYCLPDDESPVYLRWSYSAAIMELLSSITFDFDEDAVNIPCSTCCFSYTGRTDYFTECPYGLDAILLGDSPFMARVFADSSSYFYWIGTDVQDPATEYYDEEDWNPIDVGCCTGYTIVDISEIGTMEVLIHNDGDCETLCGNYVSWTDGNYYNGLNVYCTATLFICVSGQVVTLCVQLLVSVECQYRTGSGDHTMPYNLKPCAPPFPYDCCTVPEGYDDVESEEEGCATNTESELFLLAVADLSNVEGETLWEKMLNAPAGAWVSDYDQAHCNCGPPGCSGGVTTQSCPCSINTLGNCFCFSEPESQSESDPCWTPVVTGEGTPTDLDCIYAVGTVELSFEEVAGGSSV